MRRRWAVSLRAGPVLRVTRNFFLRKLLNRWAKSWAREWLLLDRAPPMSTTIGFREAKFLSKTVVTSTFFTGRDEIDGGDDVLSVSVDLAEALRRLPSRGVPEELARPGDGLFVLRPEEVEGFVDEELPVFGAVTDELSQRVFGSPVGVPGLAGLEGSSDDFPFRCFIAVRSAQGSTSTETSENSTNTPGARGAVPETTS